VKADEIRERIGAHAQASGGFYIHVVDRGYPDTPWPRERRFGPYLRKQHALEQAANDVAIGMTEIGEMVGIFSEAESLKRAYPEPLVDEHGRVTEHESVPEGLGKLTVSPDVIEKRANEIALQSAGEAAAIAQAQVEALESALPPGVSAKDVMELAAAMRAKNPALVPTNSQESD
jgi:hypothetical protein